MDASTIREWLRRSVCEITFVKRDGTHRTMRCTLKESLLPAQPTSADITPRRPASTTAIPVWSLEHNAWRSFRVDSVLAVRVVTEEKQ